MVDTSSISDKSTNAETAVSPARRSTLGFPVQKEAATYLFWSGLALLGTFVCSVIIAPLPIQLFKAEWIQRLTDTALSGGGAALIGTVFICLSKNFDIRNINLASRVLFVRRMASWAALGWILLIVLQIHAGVALIRQARNSEQQEISSLKRLQITLQSASSEEQLRESISRLPGAPDEIVFKQPLSIIKADILEQLNSRVQQATSRSKSASAERWQLWLKQMANNALAAFLMAVGFASVAQGGQGKSSLLQTIYAASIGKKSKSDRISRSRKSS